MRSILLETTARLVYPLIMVFALFMFFRGHDQPGGGFIGGLLASAGIILTYMAFGFNPYVKPIDYRLVAATGLLCAMAAGIVPMFVGKPFLSSMFGQVTAPLIGTLDVSTVLLFDFGVFLVVIGSIVGAVTVLVLEPRQAIRQSKEAD